MAQSSIESAIARLAVFAALCTQLPAQTTRQEIDSRGFHDMSRLVEACTSTPNIECAVIVGSEQSWTVPEHFHLPRTVRLRFLRGGLWILNSGVLDFEGATIDAPADSQVFKGPGRVIGLGAARPEWFERMQDGVVPAVALADAYRATVANGTIALNDAIYVSPFTLAPGALQLVLDSPRTFLGAGRPDVDNALEPSQLHHGTVIAGEIRGTAALRASHLGIDDGPETVRRYFGGYSGHGLWLGGTGTLGVTHGTSLQDISVLTNGMSGQHSVLIEGQDHVAIDGLWIWTLGGTHGLIIKSSETSVRDFHCTGASSDCLLLKSDYMTDRAGYAANIHLSGVDLHFLRTPGDTAGIFIDARWDEVHHVVFEDLREVGLKNGVAVAGSWFHVMRDLRIDRWDAREIAGPCLQQNRAVGIMVTGASCNNGPVVPMTGAAPSIKLETKQHLRILATMAQVRPAALLWLGAILAVIVVLLLFRRRRPSMVRPRRG